MEISIEIPQKARNRPTIWHSYTTAGYLPPRLQVHILLRYLHISVYYNSICNIYIMEQPRCLQRREWIKKVFHNYTDTYSSAIKNKVMSFVGKWIQVETITSSELNQSQKDKYCMFYLTCPSYILYKYIKLCIYIYGAKVFFLQFHFFGVKIWIKAICPGEQGTEEKSEKGEGRGCSMYMIHL